MTRRHQRRIRAGRVTVVLAGAAALSLAAVRPGQTFGATCDGKLATAPGDDASYQPGPSGVTITHAGSMAGFVIIGSEGDDTLIGGDGPDTICGRGGNDHIWGNGGDDVILGNSGSDYINGGNGLDTIHAGWGFADEIDAADAPAAADHVLDGGFGLFKYCHGDGADVFTNCTPLFAGGPYIGLNLFPLPPP